MSTAPARGKVMFHLPIPCLFLQLFEPISQLLAFLLREMSNGVLDGFHGHTLTIT